MCCGTSTLLQSPADARETRGLVMMVPLGCELYLVGGFGRACFWNNITTVSIAQSRAAGPTAGVSECFRHTCPSAQHFRRAVRKEALADLDRGGRLVMVATGKLAVGCVFRLHWHQLCADVPWCRQESASTSHPLSEKASPDVLVW